MPRPPKNSSQGSEEAATAADPVRTCEKCGGDNIFGPKYHRSQLQCSVMSTFRKTARTEHLHFECACGHDWIEDVVNPVTKVVRANH